MTATNSATPVPADPRMRTALITVAASGLVLAGGVLAFAGPGAGFSALLGGALATANLWALARILGALIPRDAGGAQNQSRGAWAVLAVLKLGVLLAGAWLLMRHGLATPLPFMVGFASLPIGIAIGSLVSDRSAS